MSTHCITPAIAASASELPSRLVNQCRHDCLYTDCDMLLLYRLYLPNSHAFDHPTPTSFSQLQLLSSSVTSNDGSDYTHRVPKVEEQFCSGFNCCGLELDDLVSRISRLVLVFPFPSFVALWLLKCGRWACLYWIQILTACLPLLLCLSLLSRLSRYHSSSTRLVEQRPTCHRAT